MIRVTIVRTSAGEWREFCLEGHAGAAEAGQDIVCAAVSALVLNAVNSIERFTEDGICCEAAQDGGYLKFSFTGTVSAESSLLVKSMLAGLEDVQKQYGKRYIKIRYKEV